MKPKRCPYCNEPASIRELHHYKFVQCNNFICAAAGSLEITEHAAVEAWNKIATAVEMQRECVK